MRVYLGRSQGELLNRDKLKVLYCRPLASTSRVVGQAKRFSNDIAQGLKRSRDAIQQIALEALRRDLDAMVSLVRQVIRQTRARFLHGETRSEGKILSLFEPSTEAIRKGKPRKPNEFGKMIKIQEAENQIITDYEVYDRRPNDSDLLIAAIAIPEARLGRTPSLVAAHAASIRQRTKPAPKPGASSGSASQISTESPERRREQKKRWFRNGQKWRTGCEGRISVVKRRHGLDRCQYKGLRGMRRWVALGVIADNLVNIGRALARSAST